MNMVDRAAYNGIENIMAGFEANSEDCSCYSVWYNNTPAGKAFEWNSTDRERGIQRLNDNLNALEQSGHNAVLIIRIHPETVKGVFNHRSDIVGSMYVRVNALPAGAVSVDGGYGIQDALSKIPERVQAMMEPKLMELSDRIEALELGPDREEPDLMGRITGVLNNPTLMGLINGFLQRILPAAVPAVMPPMPGNGGKISGVEERAGIEQRAIDMDRVNASLTRLNEYMYLDSDLEALANLAEKNKPLFDMMLNQLRSITNEK